MHVDGIDEMLSVITLHRHDETNNPDVKLSLNGRNVLYSVMMLMYMNVIDERSK